MKRFKLLLIFIPFLLQLTAQGLKEQAQTKIDTLNNRIAAAKALGLSVTKEEMTVRTAEVFLYYADWDEANKATNEASFVRAVRYKNNAAQMAELLPDFERNDVNRILDEAITYINKLITGEYTRNPIPKVDWTQTTIDKDRVLYENKIVFLGDYVWQPNQAGPYSLEEYHGDMDGYFVDFGKLANENGDLNGWFNTQLRDKASGTLGYIFLGNTSVPGWAETKYGPGFRMREDTYIGYDIDNPGARVLTGLLFKKVCAYSKGKKYSELGYMLCNEPHFYTTKKKDTYDEADWDWASGPVSEYTFEKFRTWLANKHGNIANLNTLWGTNFASFNDVVIDIPIWIGHIGTPMWYDWNVFNNYRVTQWFSDLKDTIRTYDPMAKIHLKVMPTMWTGNKRGHGIDMEAITNLSDIVGNDCGADVAPMWGEPFEWQTHYAYEWKELYMGFDYFKSVAPDKISFNSETHFLSTGRSRDLYMDPMYARATFWASATHGLDINQIWFWPRAEDGSPTSGAGAGYAGSNTQQPRVTNEVHSTLMDLTANSDVVMAMQRQRKPLRIFYSETSAINKSAHMNDLFELYENLKFEGVPLGFATENIINTQDNSNWDAILLWKTEFVTANELNALQNYLNNGGTLLIDAVSLKMSEYGQAIPNLSPGIGTIIHVDSLSGMHIKAMEVVQSSGSMPEISIDETNTQGIKTCIWQCVKNSSGNNVLSVINVGKVASKLNITLKNALGEVSCKNLFNGLEVSKQPTLKPFELYFVELIDAGPVIPITIPGIIEAEDFIATGGPDFDENNDGTATTGGVRIGANIINFVNAGDWAEYSINVTQTGYYNVSYSIAAPADGGQIQLLVDNQVVVTDDVAKTGTNGDEDWTVIAEQTSSSAIFLIEGIHKFKILAGTGKAWQWNLDKVTLTRRQNLPVQLAFVKPTNNQQFTEGDSIQVEVNATDDGSIDNLELYIDGVSLRQQKTEPYQWGAANQNDPMLSNLPIGIHVFKVVATDDEGLMSDTSIAIEVIAKDTLISVFEKVDIPLFYTYPNPLNNELTIVADKNITRIEIRSCYGNKLLIEECSAPRIKINTNELKAGVYILQILTEDKAISTQKILKL